MEKIQITFLGTSSAIPTATRNHSSIFVKYKDENILIDCGEATQRQIRKAKINPCKITKLLITHLHGDHVFGIPGLFQSLNRNGYQKTLEIYGPKGIKKFIKDLFKTFILTNSIKIKTKVIEVNNKVLETNDLVISALPLEHGIPTLGYTIHEKQKLRIDKKKLEKTLKKLKLKKADFTKLTNLSKGKDIIINKKTLRAKDLTYQQPRKKIAIIIDTGLCNNAKELAKSADLAIIESTFLDKTKYKHLTASQAAQIAKQAKAKSLILTHFSQRYEHKESKLLKQAKKIFPNTKLARDFMSVEI